MKTVGDPVAVIYDAVRHVLDRMGTDPEFRWHMLHTESFERLCRAESIATGRVLDDVKRERHEDRQPEYRRRDPDCSINRRLVRAYELALENAGIDWVAIRQLEVES